MDWEILQKMRQGFLDSEGHLPNYWHDERWLDAYELTLAQRIRWKWQAVLRHAEALGPTLAGIERVVDWGCGTGIASRCLLELYPDNNWTLELYDRSSVAASFAARLIQRSHPKQQVQVVKKPSKPEAPFALLVSHVLSELDESSMQALTILAQSATAVVSVEPGRPLESRRLSLLRDTLAQTHHIIGPCRHQAPCGILAAEHATDWCHFFAPVPAEIHQSAFWREFSKRMKIDLRSLPVSWLVTTRSSSEASGTHKNQDELLILARPRFFKGYCRWLACTASGVIAGQLQKRHSKDLFARLSDNEFMPIIHEQQDILLHETKDPR